MAKKSFYFFIISFFLGIFLESFFNTYLVFIFLVLFVFTISFLALKFIKKDISQKAFLVFIVLFGFFLGALRLEFFQKSNIGEFENFINQKIEKKFVIVEEPEERSGKTKLVLRFQNSKSKAIL